MSNNNAAVINYGAEKKIISNDPKNAYTYKTDYHGNNTITDASGTSVFTPNVYRQTSIMDRFVTVGGDDSNFVAGNKEIRVDNGDYTLIVGSADAVISDAYNAWAEEFAAIAAANLLPDTKIPAIPIIPGLDYNNIS